MEPAGAQEHMTMTKWRCVLELDSRRDVTAGSQAVLCDAIRRGADLRIYTEFIHNEHIDPASESRELIREVSEFRATYLVEDRWCAGIMTLRQPISLPDRFGPRASISFFMYNQDGQQAIARPYLDGEPAAGTLGPAPLDDWSAYPKYHQQDGWDAGTNAPSSNFVYDFEVYRYFVCDDWQQVLAHDAEGRPVSGSVDALVEAFEHGAEIKVAIRNLCADISTAASVAVSATFSARLSTSPAADPARSPDHEVFIQAGPGYYYTEQKLFIAGTHPLARVKPGIPMRYESRGWDFGWLMPRTDGRVAMLLYDPYTLRVQRRAGCYAIRWFVR
jgi:hypothetical protein